MHVVLVEPWFPSNQRQFVRALHAVGARVSAVGEYPLEHFDDELRHWLARYERIGSVVDEQALAAAVERIAAEHPVDRLEATIEAHMLPAARVRERLGLPGTSVRSTWLCRDKPAMKEALRAAGVPCAASTGVSSAIEAREFARQAGFPLVLKPRDAAGSAGTCRVGSFEELDSALAAAGVLDGAPAALEEFNEGHEGFYDTLLVGGRVAHDFACHYYPNVLEAMRTRWISPQLVTTNRIDAWPFYAEVREMGRRVVEAIGLETTATHMEWFYGPKGLRFSEIGCRPAGVGVWDLYCSGNDMDLYREWAGAIVHRQTWLRASRSHSAGLVNLRPDRDGRISHIEELEALWKDFGLWVIDAHIPPPGTPTQPVGAGYMANAWIRLRHPDFDRLCEMLGAIGERVHVRAR